jgi:hypothetical protein
VAFVRKIKASLVRVELEDYIGEETYIFHDIETGEMRRYNGQPGGLPLGGSSTATLSSVGDVNITSPGDGDVLTYNSTLARWVNTDPADGDLSPSIIRAAARLIQTQNIVATNVLRGQL